MFVFRPPQNNNKAPFFNKINIALNQITNKYKNFTIMGDLNTDTDDNDKNDNDKTKAQKGTSIDVLLTNRP